MNSVSAPAFIPEMASDLRAYLVLCEDVLALSTQESQSLSVNDENKSFDFYHKRKDLLSGLESSLMKLRRWRQIWQQVSQAERACCMEIKELFQAVQDMLTRVLQLDRENQQSLLRRGLVPPRHLPSAASQKPHFVSTLYQRHITS